MTVDSRLTEIEESLRLLRDAKWLQGRRVSAAAPNDNELMGFNAAKGIWEPRAPTIKFARATSSLTLTTSAQSITGDGDSSKVRVLLPNAGDWLIEATCDFHITTAAANLSCIGELFVDDSGSAESGAVVKEMEAKDRATVSQRWKVTTTAADTPVELKARKDGGSGVGVAQATQTNLAAIGIAGGTTAASATDHGNLTGLGDTADHDWATLKDGSRAFTGEQSFEQGVVIEDVDGTPVGDILLTVIDQVLRIRNSGDSAYKNVELAELIIGIPTNNGILLKAQVGSLIVRKGDDSALTTISANAIGANSIDTQTGTDRLTIGGGGNCKRLYIPISINDPATVANGDVWYDVVTNKFRAREDGASTDIIHAEYTDSDAITDVPFIAYIPFGSEPITGQSYSP